MQVASLLVNPFTPPSHACSHIYHVLTRFSGQFLRNFLKNLSLSEGKFLTIFYSPFSATFGQIWQIFYHPCLLANINSLGSFEIFCQNFVLLTTVM
jgi:hypothetical protein